MAGKPRVHEIAREFGVDAKIALRMLKEDGEFLKGPSSSMEKPVARRLRARLQAEGHTQQSSKGPTPTASPRPPVPAPPGTLSSAPSAVTPGPPRPVPAPPGTRWQATEPFIAYAQPKPAGFTEAERIAAARKSLAQRTAQRLARDAIRAEGHAARAAVTGARAETAARARWQARRDEEAAEVAAKIKRLQERDAERGARAERLKLASLRAEEVASRGRAKMALIRGGEHPERIGAPARVITEEERRAKVRQSVVTRTDGSWSAYGVAAPERQRWEKAGLGAFQAHIPAMCRAFGFRGAGIKPSQLRTKLQSGLTVEEAFATGDNIVSVMDQLAAAHNVQSSAVYDTRVVPIVPALRDRAPERLHVTTPIPRDLDASGVPKLADDLVSLTRPSPDERAVDAFNRECQHFKRTGRTGPLIKLYAEGHGVFGNLDLTRKLIQNAPMHVINRAQRQQFVNLLGDALRERQFYYLSPAATQVIAGDTDNRIPIPEEYDLPTPTGFALLRDEDGESRILLWSHGARELTATILPVADLAAGLAEYPDVRTAPTGSVSAAGTEVALALVAAIGVATRRPPSGGLDADARRAPQGLSGGTGKSRPLKRPVDEAGEPVDFVSLIYAPGEPHFEAVPTGTGRKAEKRWVVRGHWRQQWYSSTGQRYPLWIKAHEAGADEGELLTRDRVRVTR
jgi:hypothetical protein